MTNPNLSTTKDVISLTPRQMLDGTAHYLIPMYQRNFAWGNDEIEQLITDIIDAQINSRTSIGHKNYYLGTLVVFERPEPSSKHKVFEVIDGQQRFTTLSLLIIYLKNYFASNDSYYDMSWYEAQNIEFESRPKSTQTLNLLLHDNLESHHQLNQDDLNPVIINGYKSIEKVMKDKFDNANSSENQHHKVSIQDFCHYLFTYVQISRVPVPNETDLNHYFEVMNNRGEQLEKHEIIKARLLSVVEKASSTEIEETDKQPLKALIHDVWEACANMNKYVQYGFHPTLRTELFSNNLSVLKPIDFNALLDVYKHPDKQNNNQDHKSQPPSLYDILADGFASPPNPNDTADKGDDDGISETYYSLVNFSGFLLHTLRIMINIQSSNQKDIALDDKQLLTQFETYILARSVSKMSQNVETKDRITPLSQVKTFIYTLLKSKFIFDHFIIKRNMQDNKGQWTLNKLTKGEDKKNSYYKNSFENDNNDLVMLQSAFHVSTPTTNYKHWLNAVLYYSYQHYQHNDIGLDSTAYLSHIETIARAFMLRRYLTDEPDDYHHIIYQTPDINQTSFTNTDTGLTPSHLRTQIKQYLRYNNIRNIFVFNYLDYLIWLNKNNTNSNDLEEEKKKFTFTSQGSIEHFFPQNPINATSKQQEQMKDINLHRFGNLCLINRGLNSRVSNHVPVAKKQFFDKEFANSIDSLKLYKMIETLKKYNNEWNIYAINEHENEIFGLFEDALGIRIRENSNE